MAICVPTTAMGSVSVYGHFEPGDDPEVRFVVTDQRQAMPGALTPLDAIRLGRELIAEGERLTRPEDRAIIEVG